MTHHRLGAVAGLVWFASSLCPMAQEERPGWEPKEIGGREYLALDSVADFYGLKPFEWKGDEGSTGNDRVLVKFQVGSTAMSMNRVRLNLSNPVVRQEGVAYLSRIDLSKMVDPALRPGEIKANVPFRTLVLDSSPPELAVPDVAKREQVPWDLEELAGEMEKLAKGGGFDAMTTFGEGRPVSLEERLHVISDAAQPALVISVRFRRGDEDKASLQTWCLSPLGVQDRGRELLASDLDPLPGNEMDSINLASALAIHGALVRRLGDANARDGGLGWARDPLLAKSASPAMIVEYTSAKDVDPSKIFGLEVVRRGVVLGMIEGLKRFNYAAKYHMQTE